MDSEDVTVAALCDHNADLLRAQGKKLGVKHTYRVFEDMLNADIDAVIIATPMQCHVPQAVLALSAGKHVLSEVTAGVSFDELFWLVDEVEKSGKAYMMAENYLYTPEAQQVLAMARAGLFGEPYYGEGEYLHNIANIMAYPDGSPSWRRWWQYGARGLFYPTHSLGPVMKWFGNDRIDFIVALSSGRHTRPSIYQEDTSVCLIQMKSGKLIRLRVDCVSRRPHAMSNYTLQGTLGAYESPRVPGAHLVSFPKGDDDDPSWQPLSDYKEYLPERYKTGADKGAAAGHGGGDYFIIQDFIDAVRGVKPPFVDVYDACEWTAVGLLSALSVSNRGRAMDMPDFRSKSLKDRYIKL
jgi:predicted dehydrogenase